MALEVALAVQEELSSRVNETDRLRAKQVERALRSRFASQRYKAGGNPKQPVVADVLEAE